MKKFTIDVLWYAVPFVLAWLLAINPATEYGWFMGGVQGALIVPNWIISLFDSGWLLKAPLHTSAYNVFWWITSIFTAVSFIISILIIIVSKVITWSKK